MRQAAAGVTLGDEVRALLRLAREHAARTEQPVSDRRWRQLVSLLQVQAASRAATEVGVWDLWLLPFVLAAEPSHVPGWTDFFMHRVAQTAPLPLEFVRFLPMNPRGSWELTFQVLREMSCYRSALHRDL